MAIHIRSNIRIAESTKTTSSASTRTGVKKFLKRYTSSVSNEFIDDFFAMVDPSVSKKDFVIDVGSASKWIGMTKDNLMTSLQHYGFDEGSDFKSEVALTTTKSGGRPQKIVMMTTECFKGLCMLMNTSKSKQVRSYFLAVEDTLIRYRQEIEAQMQGRIRTLERNQRSGVAKDAQGGSPGVLYNP